MISFDIENFARQIIGSNASFTARHHGDEFIDLARLLVADDVVFLKRHGHLLLTNQSVHVKNNPVNEDVQKLSEQQQVTWGYVLQAPRRPPVQKQLEALKSNGVDTSEFGPVISDKVERSVRGRGALKQRQCQLDGRADMLKAVKPGDRVVVADAYCLGISPDDVAQFASERLAKDVRRTVSGKAFHLEPGDSVEDLRAEVARRQNTAHIANHRDRRSGKLPEVKRKRRS
jgi:hypothetical protein